MTELSGASPLRRRTGQIGLLVLVVLFLWQCTGAFDRSADSEAISVFGPWLGVEADGFAAVLADFEAATGIEVRYTGSANFTKDLQDRVASRIEIPDVAIIPQLGLIAELILRDTLEPMPQGVVDAIDEHTALDPADLGAGGDVYLAPYRTNIKSLVWFRPSVFEDRGWVIPRTLDELGSLVEKIQADGVAPWCFSVFAGLSTGWAATDWVEDLVLRRAGVDAYDRWIAGDLAYDSPEVRAAFEEFSDLVLEPGRTAGGVRSILETRVAEASGPMFADPIGCVMYKQASFATSWFPSGTEIGEDGDVDFFVLPGVDADEPTPLLRGLAGVVRFSDQPDVARLTEFLVSPKGGEAWQRRGGYLSPYDDVDIDDYDGVSRRFAQMLAERREERNDASDFLLSETRDLLLEEITAYIAGSRSLDELVQSVDSSRVDALDRLLADVGLVNASG